MSALVAACFLAASCSPDALDGIAERNLPIIKGRVSPSGYMPAVVALVINVPGYYQSFCTGTLIAKRWVLTAAHCLESSRIPGFTPLGVYFGNTVHTSNPSKTIIPVKRRIPHPKYVGGQAPGQLADWYDIGLLELSFDAPITPMKIIRPKEVGPAFRIGADMRIVGFGLTSASNPQSSGTKHDGVTQLQIIGSSEFYVENSGSGTTTCSGDSGGPTFANVGTASSPDYRHIGVTSRGAEGCIYGSVQTRTDSYLDWIHSTATDIPCGSGKSADCGTTPPPPTKKGLGESCDGHASCQSNLCASVSGKQVCTQRCDTQAPSCPSGFFCQSLGQGTEGICLVGSAPPAPKKKLGEPCGDHGECEHNICASQGGQTFCTKTCTPGDDSCGALECVDAGGQHVCIPKASGPEPAKASGSGCSLAGKERSARGGLLSILGLLLLCLVMRRR